MENLKRAKRTILFVVYCVFFTIVSLYANKYILNSYYNPNRIVFRLSSGVFECSLLGVTVPFYNTHTKCGAPKILANMSNLSIGFFQNNLNLEQLYNVDIVNKYCVLSYGNTSFNEKIIKDGYGVVNIKSVNDKTMLDRLLYLEDLAIENKYGLWNNFYNEMQCFKKLYN